MSFLDRTAEKLFFKTLTGLKHGSLEIHYQGKRFLFGAQDDPLRAIVDVRHPSFFRKAVLAGDTGIGEAYMDGDWTSPDVGCVIRIAIRNMNHLESSNAWFSALSRCANRVKHLLRSNSITGSKKNTAAHYDLSNEFFKLFLDESMMYSCAWFHQAGDSLEQAQWNKLDRICRKLDLKPGENILEIGTGWGSFALHAAKYYGVHVTTTTISREQHALASERFNAFDPEGSRIHLLMEDYRNLTGTFDKLVSIEMFEAVGLDFYDQFFSTCDRLLKPNGALCMQTITLLDQNFPAYHQSSDWIQKYIFPGGELASVSRILQSLERATKLTLYSVEDMGTHYARTLAEWRLRFLDRIQAVHDLGFDTRFIRMWEFYLHYCEGAFLERHASTVQLMMIKTHAQQDFSGEPWNATTRFKMEVTKK